MTAKKLAADPVTHAVPEDDDLVRVGAIARTHGLRGELVINPDTDFPEERFAPGAAVLVKRAGRRPGDQAAGPSGGGAGGGLETLTIATMRVHHGRPLVTFEGVTTIEAAEALGRPDLWIRAADRDEAPEGQFYHDELIGCGVETVGGEALGAVTRIDDTGGVPLLVIGNGADELLVPLAEAICRVIDPAARRIVIDPPEGLLDVNRR